MLNNYENANALIMRRLDNPNRPSIRELEDLLIEYAGLCCGERRIKAPSRIVPNRTESSQNTSKT